ncbi:MAG: cyclic nucleotide-binding domain-containing protein [Gammaproteobacteria bacterium]|nr:cyclic nucleotide-binding domain-containing protein [Gammaproteobacteria bacterium]
MTAVKKLVDDKYLKNLVPLGDLDTDRFNKIVKRCVVEQYGVGSRIFQIGDRDNHTVYLLSGQISLTFRSGTERIITANTKQAHHALVPEQPRQATAVAKTSVSILTIDSDALDQVLRWNETYGYEVSEIAGSDEDDNDWMTLFLQSKAFLRLRAENIQALMMRLEEIPVKASQIIVRQGDDDGYYYIVKRGACRVSRKPTPQSKTVEIATLGVGAGFGEEAIIMHDRRGATVTMTEDGQLMRLSRNDFTRLLAEPLIQVVNYEDVAKKPECVIFDVRAYADYVKDGITNSENTPLAELRAKVNTFDPDKRYVIASDTGGKASAATFLLCQQGLDAVVLSGGLAGLPDDVPRGNGSLGDLEKIPIIDNVVTLNVAAPQDINSVTNTNAESEQNNELKIDPRVHSLLTEAKQRVGNEAKKARAAEQARKKSEQEVVRLKAEAQQALLEAEKAHQQVATAAQESAEVARLAAAKEAARLREAELGCIQAEVEEAIKQAEEEAERAHIAESAYHLAQQEIADLKQEMQQTVERAQEEARKSTQAVRLLAEQEARRYRAAAQKQAEQGAKRMQVLEQARLHAETQIERLKAEAELTRIRLEEQARISADAARTEAEQSAARLRAEALAKEQAEKQHALLKAEQEAGRAAAAETARLQAEQEVERMREEAENTRVLAAQQAEQKRARELAEKQAEIDSVRHLAQAEAERTRVAEQARLKSEAEMQRLKMEAEEARQQIENKLAAEIARSETEQKVAQARAEELAKKQAEIDEIACKAQQDTERALRAEEARIEAEREIAKLHAEVEAVRKQQRHSTSQQEQVLADAELVRKQTEIEHITARMEQQSVRTQAAEQVHRRAQLEIAGLKSEMQAATRQAQAQLVQDTLHADAEQEDMRLRAEALERKEQEIERQASERVKREVLQARREAEQEIARLKHVAEQERIRAEVAIAESIKAVRQNADNIKIKKLAAAKARKSAKNQRINNSIVQPAKRKRPDSHKSVAQQSGSETDWIKAPIPTQKDYFANEAINSDNDLLFTDINSVDNEPKLRRPEMKDKRHQPGKILELDASTDDSSSWVSDQAMWETALGIRQDDKINQLIAPDFDAVVAGKTQLSVFETDDQATPHSDNRAVFRGRDTNPHLIKQASIPYVKPKRGGLFLKTVCSLIAIGIAGVVAYYYSLDKETRIKLQLEISETITGKSVSDLAGIDVKPDIAKDAAALVEKTQARIENDSNVGKPAALSATDKPTKKNPEKIMPSYLQTPQKTVVEVKPNMFEGKDVPLAAQSALHGDVASSLSVPPVVDVVSEVFSDSAAPVLPPVPSDNVVDVQDGVLGRTTPPTDFLNEESLAVGVSGIEGNAQQLDEQTMTIEHQQILVEGNAPESGNTGYSSPEYQAVNEQRIPDTGAPPVVEANSTLDAAILEAAKSDVELAEDAITPMTSNNLAQPPLPETLEVESVSPVFEAEIVQPAEMSGQRLPEVE